MLNRTPLYQEHLTLKAKLIDFGGWEMPVQYTGVIEEHLTVRSKAGLFDVSHMGEIEVVGKQALDYVQYLITNDVYKLKDGQILYSPMCYSNGGVVDDLLVYRFNEERLLLVVNASNIEKDFAWMQKHQGEFEVWVNNISNSYAQLAIQGPLSQVILQKLTSINLSELKYYWFEIAEVIGTECLISRTGYTGEDGFEIYIQPEKAPGLWRGILEAGVEEGIRPIGLGARDTLRLEAKLPLYGHELSQAITPMEAGIGFFVKFEKKHFLGKDALIDQKEKGIPRKLIGLEMVDRGIARADYPIKLKDEEIGFVTSGSFAPSLNKNIALGLIRAENAILDQEVEVLIRDKAVKAKLISTPFYKRK